jgi:hypothetical protein
MAPCAGRANNGPTTRPPSRELRGTGGGPYGPLRRMPVVPRFREPRGNGWPEGAVTVSMRRREPDLFRRGGDVPHEPVLEQWALPRSAGWSLVLCGGGLGAVMVVNAVARGGVAWASVLLVIYAITFLYLVSYRGSLTLTAEHLVIRNIRTWRLDRADFAISRHGYYGVEVQDRFGGTRRALISNSRVWWSRGMPDAGSICARVNTWSGMLGTQPWHRQVETAQEPRPARIPDASDDDLL